MAAICPNGHAVEPGAKFCSECGAALASAHAEVEPEPISAVVVDDGGDLARAGGSADQRGAEARSDEHADAEPPPPQADDGLPIFVMSTPAPAAPRRLPWKPIVIVAALLLIVLVIAVAAISGGGSNQNASPPPAAQAAPTPKVAARPTRYGQLLPEGVTVQKVAAPACRQYQTLIGHWRETARDRLGAIHGVGDDAYVASDFVDSTAWVSATTEPKFERAIRGISRSRLIGATGLRSRLVTSTMVDRFNSDALFVCHLGVAVRDTETKLGQLDQGASALVSLALTKPWYPKGYYASPEDESVAFQWDNEIGKCQANDYGYCWGMRVISRDGCPSSLYAEINVLSGDTVIGYANDTVGSLDPGDVAELAFQSFEDGYGTLSGRLKEINCS